MATPPDFTAGQVLTAAQMNAIGLWEIQSATFTTSSAETYTCFSADYDNYRIILSITATSATSASISFQLGNGGTMSTTTYGVFSDYVLNDSTTGVFTVSNFAGSAAELTSAGGDAMPAIATADILGPFLAQNTRYNAVSYGSYFSVSQRRAMITYAGGHNQATSYAQLRILPSTGTMTGSIKIFGYRN